MYRFSAILLLVATALASGCRQPVTNPQARRPLFDLNRPTLLGQNGTQNPRLTNPGWSNPFGSPFQNRMDRQTASNNDIPNLDIQTGEIPGQLANQVGELNQRIGAFNADNQELYSQVANLTQRLQVANDYNQQLKQQLTDTAGQAQQLQMAKASAEQQLAGLQSRLQQAEQYAQQVQTQLASSRGGVPSQLPGTATVRANNSLLQKINQIQIPSARPQMDGDVIRIEFPTDSLMVQGSYQVQASRVAVLQELVTVIRQVFPKQIIGVEAHWDGTPLSPAGTTDHQLTATQALSIFDELVRLGLPARQLFIMGLGSNRPKYPTPQQNRRIEVVIYPEEYATR